jgi:micrococcal nuclease
MLLLIAAAGIACAAIDGDTLNCRGERVRLLGIDAPEMPGHCRRGRHCVSGDPYASKRSLSRIMAIGPAKVERTGYDRYGRTLATVKVNGVDVSCWQLRQRQAIYRADWDDNERVYYRCPGSIR